MRGNKAGLTGFSHRTERPNLSPKKLSRHGDEQGGGRRRPRVCLDRIDAGGCAGECDRAHGLSDPGSGSEVTAEVGIGRAAGVPNAGGGWR
jgi:hypothetical protein